MLGVGPVIVRKPNPEVSIRSIGRGIGWCVVLLLMATCDLKAEGDQPIPPTGLEPAKQEPDAPHQAVKRYDIGQGPRSYLIFEPDKPRPEEKVPVVVLLHGWFAVNPGFYGAWIDHLVRTGHVVIFPRYQNDIGTMPQDFLPNAMAAIHDAMGVLNDGVVHVRADSKRFALIGHSAGANLAAQIAALAS